MLAIVFGDLVRAWRPRLLGAAVGQPSAIQAVDHLAERHEALPPGTGCLGGRPQRQQLVEVVLRVGLARCARPCAESRPGTAPTPSTAGRPRSSARSDFAVPPSNLPT